MKQYVGRKKGQKRNKNKKGKEEPKPVGRFPYRLEQTICAGVVLFSIIPAGL